MNIEKVKYYIDLVEYRSFTETARKNFVSQTTISQQIASLENEFNTLFIDRKQTPIEPTQAGWLFYNEATILWKQYNHMKAKLENHQQNSKQTLTVQYSTLTDLQKLVTFVPDFKEQYPNIELVINKVLLKNIPEYLEKGIYDVAVAFDSAFVGRENIRTYPLYQGQYCAAVSHLHPFFNQTSISKQELYEHPLVMLNPSVIGNSYDLMIEHAIKDGFQPNIQRTVDDVETELFHILTENLIGFFPDNYQLPYPEEKVRLIPLEESHHLFKIEIGYLKDNNNPALQSFLQKIDDSFFQ